MQNHSENDEITEKGEAAAGFALLLTPNIIFYKNLMIQIILQELCISDFSIRSSPIDSAVQGIRLVIMWMIPFLMDTMCSGLSPGHSSIMYPDWSPPQESELNRFSRKD